MFSCYFFDNYFLIFLLITAIVFFVQYLLSLVSTRGLPPGPRGVPILGVLPYLRKRPHLIVQRWWRMYGDVYSMYMGCRLVVVVNGVDAMKECFVRQGEYFAGRPDSYLKKLTKSKGLVFNEGGSWKEHRRFTISCLRDFGMGKVILENKIHEEATFLLQAMTSWENKSFDITVLTTKAVSNIVCSIIYGSRFDYDNEIFKCHIEALDESTRNQSLISMINFLPFLEFLTKSFFKNTQLLRNVSLRQQYAHSQLINHKETYNRENPRDFIDAYLLYMEEKRAKDHNTTFTEEHLERAIQDLFIAGTGSVSTTLRWAFLLMALNKDIQTKVQQELDEIVGHSRYPSILDRNQLRYTEATLMECQRMGNIALFNVPRCCTRDTVLQGFKIPKNTWVFVNRWGMHVSPLYWKYPDEFNPQNFLDEHGCIKKPEAFVPFGIGPRSCMGELLARTELFIFFASILQVFTIDVPNDRPTPSLEPTMGLNMAPRPYELIIKRR